MQAILRRGSAGGKRLFEESDSYALGAADFPKGGRCPGLSLDHLGKQGQPYRDDPAVLGHASDGMVQERFLVFRAFSEMVRQATISPAELAQHLARVEEIEEVYVGAVPALAQLHPKPGHEAREGHPEIITH